jgi:capsular polysaccharide biosynthesis protein
VDVLQIWRKLWRHRIVTLPVIALTVLTSFYVVAVKTPEYQASSSYVVLNPPPPPTPQDIARMPALKRISPDNPYARFSDPSVLVSLLSTSLSSDSTRRRLADAGADIGYKVAPAQVAPGQEVQQVDVTGTGSSPQQAVHTAELVGAELNKELDALQEARRVDPYYRVTTQQVVPPNNPEQQVTSTLRPLVGVFAIGGILLLIVVSAAEALPTLRGRRREQDKPVEEDEGASIGPAPEPRMQGMTGLTQPERILRALSFHDDGTPARPGERALSGRRLRERTGIKSASMYAVTSKLRNAGRIERDHRGWWRLRSSTQVAGNGHPARRAPTVRRLG